MVDERTGGEGEAAPPVGEREHDADCVASSVEGGRGHYTEGECSAGAGWCCGCDPCGVHVGREVAPGRTLMTVRAETWERLGGLVVKALDAVRDVCDGHITGVRSREIIFDSLSDAVALVGAVDDGAALPGESMPEWCRVLLGCYAGAKAEQTGGNVWIVTMEARERGFVLVWSEEVIGIYACRAALDGGHDAMAEFPLYDV